MAPASSGLTEPSVFLTLYVAKLEIPHIHDGFQTEYLKIFHQGGAVLFDMDVDKLISQYQGYKMLHIDWLKAENKFQFINWPQFPFN